MSMCIWPLSPWRATNDLRSHLIDLRIELSDCHYLCYHAFQASNYIQWLDYSPTKRRRPNVSSFVLHGFAASKNIIQCSIAYQIRTSATKNVMSHLSHPACRLLFITSDREAFGDACGVACFLEDVLLTKIYVHATYMHTYPKTHRNAC